MMIIWLVTGLIFHFSRTWLRMASTGTSIVTVYMVIRILNTLHRRNQTISSKVHQLECALKQGDKLESVHNKPQNTQHNGGTKI